MAAKEIRAGAAFVELLTKDVSLSKGLSMAQAKLKAFGAGISSVGKYIAGAGALITAPLIAAAKASADSGAAIYDMWKRTGIAVEGLSALGYAADQTSSSIDEVETAIKRMQKTISGVKDDAEGTAGSLDFLGLAAEDIKRIAPERQFAMIAERIRAIQDPTERAAAAQKVFGRSGTQLLPLIERYGELYDRAKKFGFIRSTQSATDAKALSMALYDASRASKSLWGALASAVIPILQQKMELITKLTIRVRDFVKENKELVGVIFKGATALTLMGTGLYFVGKGVGFAASGIGLLVKGIGLLNTGVTVALAGLKLAVTAIAFVASPIGIVSALLIAGGVAWAMYSESGQEAMNAVASVASGVFGDLSAGFNTLKNEAVESFSAIGYSLANGNIGEAAKVLWSLLRLEWTKGINYLSGIWADFKAGVVKVGYGAFIGVLAAWEIARNALATSFTKLSNFFGDIWDSAVLAFKDVWGGVTDWLADKFLKVQFAGDEAGYKQAKKLLDQQSDLDKKTRTEAANAARNQRDTDSQAKLDAESKRFTDAMAKLGEKFNDVADAADANAAAKKKENAASKEYTEALKAYKNAVQAVQMKKALDDLVAAIRNAAKSITPAMAGAALTPFGLGPIGSILGRALSKGVDVAKGIVSPTEKAQKAAESFSEIKSRGTFSVFAAAGMGGNSIEKQQLESQRRQEKLHEKTNDLLGRYAAAANGYGA